MSNLGSTGRQIGTGAVQEWWMGEFCILMSGWLINPKLHVAVMGVCTSIQGELSLVLCV
jgi:hypothetical protein